MTRFTFLISDMTVWCDCSHETKRHLPIGWKAMTNLKTILQSWEIIEKDLNGQSWFSGVTYRGVSRSTRTDCQNIDALQQEGWRGQVRMEFNLIKCEGNDFRLFSEGLMLHMKSHISASWGQEENHWEETDAGKDRVQKKKGTTEGEMAEKHRWLKGHGFE